VKKQSWGSTGNSILEDASSPFAGADDTSLRILHIDPAVMGDEERRRDLIRRIEATGARVRRLFHSSDIITVAAGRAQTARLLQLPAITGVRTVQPDH